MPARLVVVAGPCCGETFLVDSNDITIGRDAASQVSIPDHLVSRRHCTVESSGVSFTLRDLGSSNGTYVNGTPIRERVLEHGDRIRAGDSLLLFLQVDAAGNLTVGRGGDAACDDRTQPIRRQDIDSDRGTDEAADIEGAVVAGVLARRVTLQGHDMVGDSPPMRAVYDLIRRVAPSDCTVLISGETGTGKELAARAIHQNSPRARRPFVAVNCAVLTEPLLESELFGHEKGAFTGAFATKRGKFEIADGGTLFLDEVGELAVGLQAKLLRALQHHEFERVGSTRTIKADVRVVAASNKDLQTAAAAGQFRQDLLYRLNVVNLTMPPLRTRRADIPILAAHFAVKYGRGRHVSLSRETLGALRSYGWPGNVRELENVIERAVVLGSSDRIVVDDLPEAVVAVSPRSLPHSSATAAYHRTVLETKRRLIIDAIDRSAGNYTAAARLLGINPTYLHRLVRNLQLRDPTASRG